MYLTAHATGKPPGPTKLFMEEDNQMLNQQGHVATFQSGDQASGNLASLGADISRVFHRRNMDNT
jgi:hypothetical protein